MVGEAEIKYPVRCRIIDVTGDTFLGIPMKTPDVSKPHIGKEGIAEEFDDGWTVKITLDDGTILYGYECWWEPIHAKK